MSSINDDHEDVCPKEDRSVELTCRLCLKECHNLQYRVIFKFDGDRTISDWIEELTTLKIFQIPDTPSSLCRECESTLEAIETFRNECHSNDKLFSKIYLQEEALEELELELPKVEGIKNTSTEVEEVDEYVVVVRSGEDPENKHETVELKLESIEVTKVKEDEVEELICEKESPRVVKNKRKSKADDQIAVTNENNKNHCTICNKFVARLNQHIRIHDDNPEYRCEYCNKGFHQHSNLKKHVRTHTKEKPYICNTCEKGFTNSTELKVHSRVHTQCKPFQCTQCSKAFVTSGHLVRHIRSHTGEKPHACDVCAVRFSTTSHLIRHKRLHSQEYPFSCERCPERFTRKDYLKLHKCKSASAE
uniref:Zinc finger protein 45 n=1 Tax=Culex pipiens TaxID=7175 RepID=A0A8D8DJ58_CULPI